MQESDLFREAEAGQLLPTQALDLNQDGSLVPVHIIGDAAYPLKTWLLKPYPLVGNRYNAEQRLFNYRHSRARMVVEGAFGRLKGRWRCLLKRFDGIVGTVALVTGVCCTLHNICEMNGEEFNPEWLENINVDNEEPEQQRQEDIPPRDSRTAITKWLTAGN